MKFESIRLSLAGLGLLLMIAGPVRADDVGAEFDRLVKDHGGALVTVKYVLSMKMGGAMGGFGDEDQESELTGVMIDPKGLVICSNTQLGGFSSLMRSMMGGMGGDMTATPTQIKVLIGDDTEGRDAKFIARDTELDLAWLQIEDAGDETFAALDLSKATEPARGDRVLTLHRLGRHFGRLAVVGEARISAETKKPRKLYVPTGAGGGGLGAPVFTPSGELIGLFVLQMPDPEETSSAGFSFGSLMSMQDMMAGLILPAETVRKATARATASADED